MQANETVIVRELLPGDAEGARVVAQRAQQALRAVYRPSAELARANEMRVDNGHQLVAAHGRQIVGTVLYDQRGDKLHLQSLAVDPAWQRRGIGRALIARAVELARSRGASRLSLYTVVETGNVQVFERLGFRVVCTEPACGLEPVGEASINEAYMEMMIDAGAGRRRSD